MRTTCVGREVEGTNGSVWEYYFPFIQQQQTSLVEGQPFAEIYFPLSERTEAKVTSFGETGEQFIRAIDGANKDQAIWKAHLSSDRAVFHLNPRYGKSDLEKLLKSIVEELPGADEVEFAYATITAPDVLVMSGNR